MHAWLEEDVIQWIDKMLQGKSMWYGGLDDEAGGCLASMRCWRYEEGLA